MYGSIQIKNIKQTPRKPMQYSTMQYKQTYTKTDNKQRSTYVTHFLRENCHSDYTFLHKIGTVASQMISTWWI